MKNIIFKKIKNRYELKPEERVLKELKKYKKISATKLSQLTSINYDTLSKMLDRLIKKYPIMIQSHNQMGDNELLIRQSKLVIWRGLKKR